MAVLGEIKEKSNALTYLGECKKFSNGKYFVKVRCVCGTEKFVNKYNYNNGVIKTCGCLKGQYAKDNQFIKNYRIYHIYNGMKSRCENPKNHAYHWYGARNIKVSNEWSDFQSFQTWALNNGYADNLSIDRIDTNKSYSPDNCRWVDMKVQNNNRRNNKRIEYKGEVKTLSEWCDTLKIPMKRTSYRLTHGWTVEDAFEVKKLGER